MIKAPLRGHMRNAAAAAMLVAAMAAAATPLPAYAEQASVTIVQQANPNAVYKAYCLFIADIDDSNRATNIAWAVDENKQAALITYLNEAGAYDAWLETQGLGGDAGASAEARNVCRYMSAMIGSSAGAVRPDGESGSGQLLWPDAGSFASELAAWVVANLEPDGTAQAGVPYTDDEGYYLFVSDGSTVAGSDMATVPIWFALGGSATLVDEKADPAQIVKEVGEDGAAASGSEAEDAGIAWRPWADAEVGQEVPYRISVTIPGNYGAFSSYKVRVSDTLPTGLALVDGASGVSVHANGADVTDCFAVTYTEQTRQLVVENGDTKNAVGTDPAAGGKLVPGLAAGTTLTVTYRAYIASLDGLETDFDPYVNSATFTFSNDPQGSTTGTTLPTSTDLYTYALAVRKYDESTGAPLAGAKFVLRNNEADPRYLAYDEATDTWGWTASDRDDAHVFITDADGMIDGIYGLDAGVYTLIEVAAPSSYDTPAAPNNETQVTIVAERDDEGNLVLSGSANGAGGLDQNGVDANRGVVTVAVGNDREHFLAVTGAQGVGLGGVALVALGAGWYVARRRRQAEERDA